MLAVRIVAESVAHLAALEPSFQWGGAQAVMDEAEAVVLDDERVVILIGLRVSYHQRPFPLLQ
jgi:hypothetical protein